MRWLLVAVAAPALAQGLHFGLKAGVPLTAYYETGVTGGHCSAEEYSAATRRYTAGPAVEYRMPHWGIEADLLFKRQGYVRISQYFGCADGKISRSAYDVKGDSWDVPVLLKYRFARWYLAGGVTLRYVGPVRALGESTVLDQVAHTTTRTPIDITDPGELNQRWYTGVAAGVGRELGWGRLRLQPEFRYTLWVRNITGIGDHALRFAPNQAELLLGLLF